MSEAIDVEVVEEHGTELEHVQPSTLFRTDDAELVLDRATRIAEKLAPIVEQRGMFSQIGDKRHVQVEGWLTLAAMLGVTPVTVWTRKLTDPDGWEARVEARTLDGRTIGAAEAECLTSEERWKDAEDYARRSMAQTRATSKALSSVLRFVMTLGGFSGTPAEEMDGVKSGSRSGAALAPTDKQLNFLNNLLRDRDDFPNDLLPAAGVWAKQTLTGGRDGSLSELLDILSKAAKKDAPEGAVDRGARATAALTEKVREALAAETDVPADLEGLEQDQPELADDLPF